MEEKRITENETVAFEAWLRGQEKAAATVKKYVLEAAAFLAYLGGAAISRENVLEKDIVKLADILGHSSVNTTRIYTVSTGAEHLRKMERMQLVC